MKCGVCNLFLWFLWNVTVKICLDRFSALCLSSASWNSWEAPRPTKEWIRALLIEIKILKFVDRWKISGVQLLRPVNTYTETIKMKSYCSVQSCALSCRGERDWLLLTHPHKWNTFFFFLLNIVYSDLTLPLMARKVSFFCQRPQIFFDSNCSVFFFFSSVLSQETKSRFTSKCLEVTQLMEQKLLMRSFLFKDSQILNYKYCQRKI